MLVIVINGVGIPARIIPPFFADRFGPLNVILPMSFCICLVTWCWLAVGTVSGLYVFAVFCGLAQAGFQCIFPATMASITSRLDMAGTRLGMAFSLISVAALTGPPIGGAIQRANGGSFVGSQIFAAVLTLFTFALVLTARVVKGGWSWRSKC